MAVQLTRPTRPASTAPRSTTSTTTTEPGAPATRLDEALATFLAGLAIACSAPWTSADGFVVNFGKALRSHGGTKLITEGKVRHSPSAAQQLVARAQAAGLVEGDVMARLEVEA